MQVGSCELFTLEDNEDGSWTIQLPMLGLVVCTNTSLAGNPLITIPLGPGALPSCMRMRLQGTTDGSFALQALAAAGPDGRGGWVRAAAQAVVTAAAADPRGLPLDSGRFVITEV